MMALGVPAPLVKHMMRDKSQWHPMRRQTMLYVQWQFATHVLHISLKEYLQTRDPMEQRLDYWGEVMKSAYEDYWTRPEKERTWWPGKTPPSMLYDGFGKLIRE